MFTNCYLPHKMDTEQLKMIFIYKINKNKKSGSGLMQITATKTIKKKKNIIRWMGWEYTVGIYGF